jgi:hypothetical protein
MNKQRRETLRKIQSTIGLMMTKVTESKEMLETIRDEEQEAYDNLPESLQDADKGQDMQEAIDYMDAAISDLDDAFESMENAMNQIEDAKSK